MYMEFVKSIVLPGLDGTRRLLEDFRVAAPLGTESSVVAYPADQLLGYRELQSLVESQLPDEPFILIAESFSGPIAVRLAEKYPGRVKALVLCASFVAAPRPRFLRHFARRTLFRLRLPERVLAFFMLAPFATPALTSAFSRVIREVDPAVIALRLREVLSVDARASLANVKVPVLYLRGKFDRLVPPQDIGEVVELDAPHAILQVAPQAAWAAITRTR